jgi:hypothetical protein
MKAIEFGAAPQMAEPTSKSMTAVKKVALTFMKVYIFPNSNMNVQLVRR